MNSLALIDLILSLASRMQAAGQLIKIARAEGRDVTTAELDELAAADDAARDALVDAIAKAKEEGR
jgi:hypothetical protein